MNALSCFPVFCSCVCYRTAFSMIPQPDDNVTTFTGKCIWEVFAPGQMMEGYVMDFLIDDWKKDPDRNVDFASGKRVLLSPYFIMVINQIVCFSQTRLPIVLRVLIILCLLILSPCLFLYGLFAGCA